MRDTHRLGFISSKYFMGLSTIPATDDVSKSRRVLAYCAVGF